MIAIEINTQDLTAMYDMSRADVDNVIDYSVKEVAAMFARKWEDEARHLLHSTRQVYIDSLHVVDEGRLKGAVVLSYNQKIVQMIEEGVGAFDIKEGFAKSDKRIAKDDGGWYLTVPMKIGSPSSLGETLGFSSIMPQEVYKVAKNLESREGSTQSKALKATQVPKGFSEPKTRHAFGDRLNSKVFEAYKHKSSIYQGIVKQTDTTTGQSSYMSFRRVSDRSDPNAFIHPGIETYNIGDKALDGFDSEIENKLGGIIDSALDEYGIY